jgi:hypothetical protein
MTLSYNFRAASTLKALIILATLLFVPVWFVLMAVTTNLIGFVVRGFFLPSMPMEDASDRVIEILKQEEGRYQIANFAMTMIAIALTCIFLHALYHFWNVSLSIAAGMLMLSRLPDLLWEIRNGQPRSIQDLPKTGIFIITTGLMWLSLPLIWYSLYVGRG